jgi:hypothetical protein
MKLVFNGPNGYTDKTIDYDLINNGKGKVPDIASTLQPTPISLFSFC